MENRTVGPPILNKQYRIWYLDEGRVRTKNAVLLDIKDGVIFYYNIEHGYIEGISNGRLLRMESFDQYDPECLVTKSSSITSRSKKDPQKVLGEETA